MRCLLQMKDGSVRAEEVIEETVRIMMTSYGPNGAP